ncbi:MAG: helix-turn-helix transcriptional regulator [Anaerolineaceae bacterium]|nr:helix-turn-helix transcriptional regulator [Anaerolineaceae bacterium]
MARTSAKENKSIYQQKREEMGLSREKAAELLKFITADRIERIENGKSGAHPDEVALMAQKYQCPYLCNYYCANECEIGRQYVPEIKTKELSQIILEMLASLNSMQRKQERLIEITSDGVIDEAELHDFTAIQAELEKISITVETLQLWVEQNVKSRK